MIKTERLTLEPFDMKYLEAYHNNFNSEITKYQWPDPFETIDDAKALLQDFIDEMNAGAGLCYSILNSDGEFVGSAEVHGLQEECPEVGIWLIESQQRKGYAFEALSKVLDYVYTEYNKEVFFYEADVRNEGSNKLLNKLSEKFDIIEQGVEELVTDSGKELQLKGNVLKRK